MDNLSDTLSRSIINSFQDYNNSVQELSQELNEAQFWHNPYSYGNSFGHLVLHLTGNLNHFIGTHIADTGYVRQRELEFTDPNHYPKQETLMRLQEAVDMVVATVERQNSSSWTAPYAVGNIKDTRLDAFLRTLAHFHHHLGQMIYLVRELSAST
ncbi:MAG: DinB family protein [Deinococcota bacterium]